MSTNHAYVVVGSHGEYSDRRVFVVATYGRRSEARRHVRRVSRLVRTIVKILNENQVPLGSFGGTMARQDIADRAIEHAMRHRRLLGLTRRDIKYLVPYFDTERTWYWVEATPFIR